MVNKAKDYQSTLERLLFLINEFYKGRSFTIKEIAQTFETSPRTASRYINDYLKKAGFTIKKDGRKIYLERKFSEDAHIALEAIENFARECGIYPKIKDYLEDLSKETNTIFTKLLIENIDEYYKNFALIQKAIESRNLIEFEYKFSYSKSRTYKVKPLKLATFEGYWYLLVVEYKYKSFHFKSIDKIKVLDETFEKMNINLDNAINIWYDPFKKPIIVELIADKWASQYLRRIPLNPTQKEITTYPDKSTLFEIKITDFEEIKWFIKRFIPQIRVLSPKELKDEINEEIRGYLNN